MATAPAVLPELAAILRMRFAASHTTRFRYSEPVYLEPHVIRLRPRSDCFQRLLEYRLKVTPAPEVLSEGLDADGNVVAHAWFAGLSESLTVTSEFEVETLRTNPFDYLVIGEGSQELPIKYPAPLRDRLAPSLARPNGADPGVAEFIRPIMARSERQALAFLSGLNQAIHEGYRVTVREHGEPLPPARTLAAEQVACRDLAALFMDCCRALGIAARFVSGYQDQRSKSRFMHAWAEVYLPGGGWRGYDPTQGLAVGDRHIAVAAANLPSVVTPIRGSYRGDAVAVPLEAEVRVSQTDMS